MLKIKRRSDLVRKVNEESRAFTTEELEAARSRIDKAMLNFRRYNSITMYHPNRVMPYFYR